MLREKLKDVLENWQSAKKEAFSGHRLGQVIRNELVQEIENIASTKESTFVLKGSIGAGNWADVPWVSILHSAITQTTQGGIYPVYLFCADGSGVYLSLNQGTTKLKEKFGTKGAKQEAKKNADSIFPYCELLLTQKGWTKGPLDLKAKTITGKSYEEPNVVAKFYPVESIPSDQELISDLDSLLSVYERIAHNYPLNSEVLVEEPKEEYDVFKNNVNTNAAPLNQILYGPPGTGKTYTTINKALQIVTPDFYLENKDNREKLKARFDELLNNNRIGFVTFHQSFSYEDFVEGLKASTTEDKQISYDVEDGIFKSMCNSASVKATVNTEQQALDISNRKIWKMSLGDTSGEDAFIYQQCIENNYVLLGYGYDIDFSNTSNRKEVIETYRTNEVIIEKESSDYRVTSVNNFKNEMSIGDLVVISDGNRKFRAIAEITSDYIFDETLVSDSGYSQVRKVTWHRVYEPSLPVDELFKKNLSQMTLYRLYGATIDLDKLQGIFSLSSIEDKTEVNNDRVLIIDEINRGNISNIFGELITLIEPSKRSGGTESLSVKLPYSKETFSVPSNLHIIGTMNTADKSLAQLDIALRRRFEFVEMMTNYELLKGIPNIEGINVAKLVKTMNQRIELLYDREHTIGHSFFLPLLGNPSLQLLAEIFELQILPLLEEYFFEDWERVGQVLGDHLKDNHELRFVIEQFGNSEIAELMGDDWEVQGIQPYCRNQKAFLNPQAYIGVYTR